MKTWLVMEKGRNNSSVKPKLIGEEYEGVEGKIKKLGKIQYLGQLWRSKPLKANKKGTWLLTNNVGKWFNNAVFSNDL